MKSMQQVLSAIILLMLLSVSASAAAAECAPLGTLTIPSQTFMIQSSLKAGMPIGPEIASSGFTPYTGCPTPNSTNPDPNIAEIKFGIQAEKALDNSKSSINNRQIFSTGITGIGYALAGSLTSDIASYGCDAKQYIHTVDPSLQHFAGPNSKLICFITNGLFQQPMVAKVFIQLYKTGDITPVTHMVQDDVGRFILKTTGDKTLFTPIIHLNPVTVKVYPCTLNLATYSVDMGHISKRNFTGIGSTSTAKPFPTIVLTNCGENVALNLRLQPNEAIVDTGNHVFALDNPTGDTTAKGVGMQLLDTNNNPLDLNSTLFMGNTTNGNYSLFLKARYYQYQTSSLIKAGVANATATFQITYR